MFKQNKQTNKHPYSHFPKDNILVFTLFSILGFFLFWGDNIYDVIYSHIELYMHIYTLIYIHVCMYFLSQIVIILNIM